MLHAKRLGFTLIEMIVVIGVIGLTLPVFFTIVFSILQQQARLYALQEVKRQGDNMLSYITASIKNNTTGIYSSTTFTPAFEKCSSTTENSYDSDPGPFYFKDKNSQWFRFYLVPNILNPNNNDLVYNSLATSYSLNNNKVTVTDLLISCYRLADYSTAIVTVSYDVNIGTTTLNFKTRSKLKNY